MNGSSFFERRADRAAPAPRVTSDLRRLSKLLSMRSSATPERLAAQEASQPVQLHRCERPLVNPNERLGVGGLKNWRDLRVGLRSRNQSLRGSYRLADDALANLLTTNS